MKISSKQQIIKTPQIINKLKLKSFPTITTLTILTMGLSACQSQSLLKEMSKPSNPITIAEPNIAIDQPYKVLDNITISNKKHPSIAIQRWQLFYSDPKLSEIIKIAVKNNKNLESAMLAIKQAKTQYQISDNDSLPIIAGNAGFERGRANNNTQNSYNVGLALPAYELDLWGRVANLKNQALQSYLATTAGKDTVQISLISNIAQVYVNLSFAKAQYQLAKSTVESRKHSLFITLKRFEAGVDAKTPSLQAASSLENAKIAMYNAETSILKLRNALQSLVGQPIDHKLEPDAGLTNITNQRRLSAGLPSELLHYRPDILQAEYKLKAAGANIEVARASFFPAIKLTGRLGLGSNELSSLLESNKVGWSFGPSVSFPVFDAGQLSANYQLSKIQQQQALIQYEKAIQQAFKEVSDILAERATLQRRLLSQYKLQQNFNETYIIANARFKSGLSNYLGVLDAERSKFATQQGILQLEKESLISQVKLYQALGGGVAMDVPVKLPVPNEQKLVEFITADKTADRDDNKNDSENVNTDTTPSDKNKKHSVVNTARISSDTRIATPEDFRTLEKFLVEKNNPPSPSTQDKSEAQKESEKVVPEQKMLKKPVSVKTDDAEIKNEKVIENQKPHEIKNIEAVKDIEVVKTKDVKNKDVENKDVKSDDGDNKNKVDTEQIDKE